MQLRTTLLLTNLLSKSRKHSIKYYSMTGEIIENRNKNTRGRIQRTADYVEIISKSLKVNVERTLMRL